MKNMATKLKPVYAIWIEDIVKYVDTLLYNLKPDFDDFKVDFISDTHDSGKFIVDVARAIDVDMVLVDYNLPNGINGDDVIKIIRSFPHNDETPIIFYSSNMDAEGLQKLLIGVKNVTCCHRDSLGDEIIRVIRELV